MNPQELESPKTMIRNVCAKQGLATVRMAIRQNSFFMDCSGWGIRAKRCFCGEIRRWAFDVKVDSSLARKTRKRQCLRMCVRW